MLDFCRDMLCRKYHQTMYDTGKDIKCYFEIGADGNAEMKCFVAPMDGNMMDQVEVTFKISKVNGTIYYNRTFEAQWSDVKNRYELTKEFDLSRTVEHRKICFMHEP